MKKVTVDQSACICCGSCMSIAPDVFGYGEEGTSVPKMEFVNDNNKEAITAMESCPTCAIQLIDEDSESSKCESCNSNPCKCDNCEKTA